MSYWQEKIKIGNLEFPRFIGGPLDGITDSPFRKLVRKFSEKELLYTEMRHVACVANDRTGSKSLKLDVSERPLNYQIAANSITFIDQACDKILEKGVDCIDLNIGCPSKQVTGSGSGSALMADLPRLIEIVTHLRKRLTIPLTVKIRSGFKECNALEVAKALQDCGVDALAIHPRLRTQRFEGRPDYALVEQVKKALTIPVIVSGGIVNFNIAKMVYEQTGVDGFLIGRGIWARPWKLQELKEHALGNEYKTEISFIFKCALEHLDNVISYYGVHGLFVFRKHLPFYIRGIKNAAQLRKKLMISTELQEVRDALVQASKNL